MAEGIDLKKNFIIFAGLAFAGIALFWKPLVELSKLSFESELYSHFFLIPLIGFHFFLTERRKIFFSAGCNFSTGIALLLVGLVIYGCGLFFKLFLETNDFLSLSILAFIIWIAGGFLFSFGYKAFQKARFPLLFLGFMIPIPLFILGKVVSFLQVWSAHTVQLMFDIMGFSYWRDGLNFQVPGSFYISIAEECSGIRSSLGMVIGGVLAGFMFLRTNLTRILFMLLLLPATVFKNALRIVTLTFLASTRDLSWLTNSWLHHSGGIVFFLITLFILAPILWGLRKSEHWRLKKSKENSEARVVFVEGDPKLLN